MTEAIGTGITATLAQGRGRKVHLAFNFQHGAPSCDRTEGVTRVVAELPDNGGLTETVTTIVKAGIRPSRLCCHCFCVRTRKAVADAYAARTAVRNAHRDQPAGGHR